MALIVFVEILKQLEPGQIAAVFRMRGSFRSSRHCDAGCCAWRKIELDFAA